jgi:hypothetical protein
MKKNRENSINPSTLSKRWLFFLFIIFGIAIGRNIYVVSHIETQIKEKTEMSTNVILTNKQAFYEALKEIEKKVDKIDVVTKIDTVYVEKTEPKKEITKRKIRTRKYDY